MKDAKFIPQKARDGAEVVRPIGRAPINQLDHPTPGVCVRDAVKGLSLKARADSMGQEAERKGFIAENPEKRPDEAGGKRLR